jgi:preprotein translocase subunit SecY
VVEIAPLGIWELEKWQTITHNPSFVQPLLSGSSACQSFAHLMEVSFEQVHSARDAVFLTILALLFTFFWRKIQVH